MGSSAHGAQCAVGMLPILGAFETFGVPIPNCSGNTITANVLRAPLRGRKESKLQSLSKSVNMLRTDCDIFRTLPQETRG